MHDLLNKRILIVDSNSAIHEDFQKIFCLKSDSTEPSKSKQKHTQQSYSLDSAYDGEQAFQLIQQAMANQHPYTVAFIDLHLSPSSDGLAMIQRIWELDPDLQLVLSIAYSHYSYQDVVEKLQHPDPILILNKPFDINEIRQLVFHLSRKQDVNHTIQQNINALEEKINYQSTHDGLTGLGNRLLLTKYSMSAIAEAEKDGTLMGVVLLSIDNLKEVNTFFGISTGDSFIKQIAEKLRAYCSKVDLLIRLSNHEFLIILADQASEDSIVTKINQLVENFQHPLNIENHSLFVSTHIGASIFPRDGKELDLLLKNAETALSYSAKTGKKAIQFYNKTDHDIMLRRAALIIDLPRALKNNQFILHYQPLIKADSSKILGVEALIRWQHPDLGLLYPQEFLSLAEEIGLISSVDEWVLKTACARVKKWQETINSELLLAVNVSSHHMCQPNFEWLVQKTLKKLEFEPRYLEFDIIANPMLMGDHDTLPKMNRLKESGIRLSLDNFGVGYANLDYLQFFPFDKVKIDRSFVNNIQLNDKQNKAIEAIIYFAKKMGIKVVAGGVETPEQVEFLFNHHGGEMQGFYFSPPLNEEACGTLLKKQIIVKEEG